MLSKKSSNDRLELFSKVKNIADHIIQTRLDTGRTLVFAKQIASELKVDYNIFDNLFLSEYGITLERVYVMRVVEKVKELLVYTEQSLKQIAGALGYNNPSSLSDILKYNTGFTSTYFKQIRKNKLEIIRKQQTEQNGN
ncbi:helix-turn-helix domain-containing protein [Chryseobacterium sp. WG23]|uniref:helix-turn-helix domain-containing protein n=1 Tax=Chryseobacterium sp. WG23 TaxID=2926910 RepID=UPI00211F46D7|nr:AraC family transcriptional regulator [Chryseobacterium sp. WG23]MCQ9637322.1 helix-turn-helix domain-containing protein [Chryseobacterium sp. WG23]